MRQSLPRPCEHDLLTGRIVSPIMCSESCDGCRTCMAHHIEDNEHQPVGGILRLRCFYNLSFEWRQEEAGGSIKPQSHSRSEVTPSLLIHITRYELKSWRLLGLAFLAAAVSLVSFNFLQQLINEVSISDGFQVWDPFLFHTYKL